MSRQRRRDELLARARRNLQSPHSLIEVNHLLPLPLQDFCLLRVINDLDSYPVELLESLPKWLRYRLLNNLPSLDLCRLDHTTVARGIDVNQLWKTRLQALKDPPTKRLAERFRSPRDTHTGNTTSAEPIDIFQLDITVGQESSWAVGFDRFRYPPGADCSLVLKWKIASAFNAISKQSGVEAASAREAYLLDIVSNILSCSPSLSIVNRLVSIPGEHLLLNLVVATRQQQVTPKHSYGVWKKQATAFMMKPIGIQSNERPLFRRIRPVEKCDHYGGCIVLYPHRLSSLSKGNGSSMRLLSLLANHCGIHPTSANIHVQRILDEILHALYTARIAQDSGFEIASHDSTCISIIHHFLKKVIILRLRCDKYAEIGVMIEMIKAATADGEHCQLKYLFCTLPDIYVDIVPSLSIVFSLQNFYQLFLELDEAYLLSLGKLLFAFMTAPCPGTQQLCIHIKRRASHLSKPLEIAELATLDMKEITVPHCAVEHKVLEILPKSNVSSMLYIILQWPTIRLNGIVLDGLNINCKYLHLCALHPDLQVMKLAIAIDESADQRLLDTVQQDLIALLAMPTLREIAISAFWGSYTEVKAGLVQGLSQRASWPPLRKISIDEAGPGWCSEKEYRRLWNAIFSLPQLDQLEIALSRGAIKVIFKHLNVVSESWVENASGIQLKAIYIKALATEVNTELISQFAQTCSFISKDDLFTN